MVFTASSATHMAQSFYDNLPAQFNLSAFNNTATTYISSIQTIYYITTPTHIFKASASAKSTKVGGIKY